MLTASTSQPNLLMLSHCVPDPLGGAARARAWQLFDLAGRSGRVHLVCLRDGPVHLAQWRALTSRAAAVKIASYRQMLLAGRGLDRWATRLIQTFRPQADVGLPFDQWLGRASFDAVLSTTPILEPHARRLDPRLRICDESQPRPQAGHPAPLDRPGLMFSRSGNNARRRAGRVHQRDISVRFHRSGALAAEPTINTRGTITLPDLPDVVFLRQGQNDQFTPDSTPLPAGPVVFHADWTHAQARRTTRSLMQKLDPIIRKALPDVQLLSTRSHPNRPYALDLLRQAQVVICVGADPRTALWATMQALAIPQAVITDRQTAAALQIWDQHEAVVCATQAQVILACMKLLRDPAMQHRLAESARAFADQKFLHHPSRARFHELWAVPSQAIRPLAPAA